MEKINSTFHLSFNPSVNFRRAREATKKTRQFLDTTKNKQPINQTKIRTSLSLDMVHEFD